MNKPGAAGGRAPPGGYGFFVVGGCGGCGVEGAGRVLARLLRSDGRG